MPARPTQTRKENYRDCPTAWFVVLERARAEHDHERAALAIRELRRLGVTVRFTRREGEAVTHVG